MRPSGPRPTAENGGLPMPAASLEVARYRAWHLGCGRETVVALPAAVPSRAVASLVCSGCGERFRARLAPLEPVADLPPRSTSGARAGRVPRLPRPGLGGWRPRRHTIALVAAALLALAAVAALLAGSGSPTDTPGADPTAGEAPAHPERAAQAAATFEGARLVQEPLFALALPGEWWRAGEPEGGAAFQAIAPEEQANVQLWVERDAELSLGELEARARAELTEVAGLEPEVDDIPAGIRLTARGPDDAAELTVTLAQSADRLYYLSTTLEPGAASEIAQGVELIRDSFVPTAALSR